MSPEIIAGIVAVVLLALISAAIAIQTIEKNNKEKRRMETALKARIRNFNHMLTNFPDGFLGKDLQLLVCQCLVDVYEQLKQLQPGNKQHSAGLASVNQQITQLSAQASQQTTVTLTDTEQIKEIQQMLSSLFNFIARLRASGRINDQQAQVYAQQIRQLTLQTSLDALNQSAKQAIQIGKHKLAIHYYHMAVDKLKKENADGNRDKHLASYQERIAQLEAQLGEREQANQENVSINTRPVKKIYRRYNRRLMAGSSRVVGTCVRSAAYWQ